MYYVDMIKKRTLLGKPKALTAFCSIFMLLCLATEATAQSGFVTPEKVQLTGGTGYDGKTYNNTHNAITSITLKGKYGTDDSKTGGTNTDAYKNNTLTVSGTGFSYVDMTSKKLYANAGEAVNLDITRAKNGSNYINTYVYINTNQDNKFEVKLNNNHITASVNSEYYIPAIHNLILNQYNALQGEVNEMYAYSCVSQYEYFKGTTKIPDPKKQQKYMRGGYWNGSEIVEETVTGEDGENRKDIHDFNVPSKAGIYRMRVKRDFNNIDPNFELKDVYYKYNDIFLLLI